MTKGELDPHPRPSAQRLVQNGPSTPTPWSRSLSWPRVGAAATAQTKWAALGAGASQGPVGPSGSNKPPSPGWRLGGRKEPALTKHNLAPAFSYVPAAQ